MGIIDYYEYIEAMETVTGSERGSLSLKMAVNAGILDKNKSTIEEFLQEKNREKDNG